jgi:hypothetical protein
MNPIIPSGRLSQPYTDGAYRIYPNSLLFRSGNYADKNFSMTTGEIATAAQDFAPVRVNLEHAPTVLQGKLGEVRAAYVDPNDPDTLRGEVAIPTWLDAQLTDEERRVSAEFDRTTKRLVGLALTPTPRVTDAALMAAFTNAQEPGRVPGQSAARSGEPTERTKSMDVVERLEALLANFGKQKKADEEKSATDALKSEVDSLKTQLAEFTKAKEPEKKVASFSEADAKQKAAEFTSGLIRDRKCLPAEREAIENGFIAAFRADHAVASFSGDVLLTPVVDAFKVSQNARVPHQLTTELLVDASPDAALFAYGNEKKPEAKKPRHPSEIMASHNGRNDAATYGTSKGGH